MAVNNYPVNLRYIFQIEFTVFFNIISHEFMWQCIAIILLTFVTYFKLNLLSFLNIISHELMWQCITIILLTIVTYFKFQVFNKISHDFMWQCITIILLTFVTYFRLRSESLVFWWWRTPVRITSRSRRHRM